MDYIEETSTDIQQTLEEAGCQPIIFAGTGLSIRYFGAPNWEGLLKALGDECPSITRPIAYYKQRNSNDLIEVGQEFSAVYQEWAWEGGRSKFPEELFDDKQTADVYVKYAAANIIRNITPDSLEKITDEALKRELAALAAIQPHALITTNYDCLLELIFPEFLPVVGESILKKDYSAIGEIFKIHGCVSQPSSLVLIRDDFNMFAKKRKYVSAKLLTYLSEHPVLFAGYSASDPNVHNILADIDEILSPDGALISNMYFLEREANFDPKKSYPKEKLIQVGENRSVRVRCIKADDFEWVFKAFAAKGSLEKVNTKLLRSLMARIYDLVRVDIPRQTVQVDYKVIQGALAEPGGVPQLLGLAAIDKPGAINANFP